MENPIEKIFKVTALPAFYGDAFWVSYGTKEHCRHLIIDGGTATVSAIIDQIANNLPKEEKVIELLVVTHVDSDHIGGILKFLQQEKLPAKIKQIWFNAYKHLASAEELKDERLGGKMGEKLSIAIGKHKIPWNTSFNEGPVVLPNGLKETLPEIILDGDLKLILLSPSAEKLAAYKPFWEAEVKKAGLIPGYGGKEQAVESTLEGLERMGATNESIEELAAQGYMPDKSKGNGSSIAFMAEFEGRRVLFSGDAHPDVILSSLRRYGTEKVKIDLVKVSHHGSTGNTGFEIIEAIDCKNYLLSTNHSHHPTMKTIAYLVTKGTRDCTLHFNYPSQCSKPWESALNKSRHKYSTNYGDANGLTIDILALI